MTEAETDLDQARKGAAMRGRFALFGDGTIMSLSVAYATDLCDTCSNCKCGTQQEPLTIKKMIAHAASMGMNPMQLYREYRGRGDDGDE